MQDFPPFPGFRKAAFDFLQDLKQNNQRDWFHAYKTVFEDEILWPFHCLLTDVSRQLSSQAIPLVGDPKRSIFRIHRDTRFSKNKDPYKTHVGAIFSQTGDRKEAGVLYVHLEPGASFLGAGYWQPESSVLRAWRARMAADPTHFLEMVAALSSYGLSLSMQEDMLKRMPQGYESLAETDLADFMRMKSFVTSRPVSDQALSLPDFSNDVVRMAHEVLPLLQYGWRL